MYDRVMQELDKRRAHFARMRDMEMENGKEERDAAWKQRSQYLQGRVQGLDEAIDIVQKCCLMCPPRLEIEKEREKPS